MTKKEKLEKIKTFLEGRDDQKYITGIEANGYNNEVFLMFDNPDKGKYMEKHRYTPFLFCKDFKNNDIKLYGGNKNAIKKSMDFNGITFKSLRTDEHPRLEYGYKYLVTTSKQPWNLNKFFKDGGLDPFKNKDLFLSYSNLEQFFITTGKRLFKGYNTYDDIHKFYFDIETTSLKPEDGNIFLIGMKDNRGFKKVLTIDKNDPINSEIEMIIEFFDIIINLKPTQVAGYNSEAFDFTYILGRAAILGVELGGKDEDGNVYYDVRTSLNPDFPISRKPSTIKFGGETENYEKTVMWGINVVDIAHAVRATKAINSDIKGWGLKYITNYVLAKKKITNEKRMYVEGDKIYKIWNENKNYYINKNKSTYKLIPTEYQDKPDDYIPKLKELVKKVKNIDDKTTLVPKLQSIYEFFDGDENNVGLITGSEIIYQYLLDDISETEIVDNEFCQANFMMGGILPTTYVRACTMGNASKWKMLLTTYSYENGIAIPVVDRKRDIVGGLSRLFKTGFNVNVVKMDYKSLYPRIQLTHDIFPSLDITGVMESMLNYFIDGRVEHQLLAKKYEDEGNMALASLHNTKQLPIKILSNSQFGALSSPLIFNWGDNNIGERITCTGRQYLRLMVHHFMKYGFHPVLIDTDGTNFTLPLNHESFSYTTKKGKVVNGYDAVLAEFNDKYMTGVMWLEEDDDKVLPVSINFARKNYANLKQSGKTKFTGNSIKSSNLQIYVEKFFKKAIGLLLEGKGKDFIEEYYHELTRIYNKQIPLIEIASKAKVKQKVKDYQNDLVNKKNKNGRDMSRKAFMELLIENNLDPDLGQNIYYVNNGTKKSHKDLGHSYLVDEMDFITNPDKTGDYNVPKAIDSFNNRVSVFLVCFSQEVRDTLLITNPKDRNFYTSEQMILISGIPVEDKDQDVIFLKEYKEGVHENVPLMEMEEREIIFWNKIDADPRDIFDGFTTQLSKVRLLSNEEKVLKKIQEEKIINFFKEKGVEIKRELDFIREGDEFICYKNKYTTFVKNEKDKFEENVKYLDKFEWILSTLEIITVKNDEGKFVKQGIYVDIDIIEEEIYI